MPLTRRDRERLDKLIEAVDELSDEIDRFENDDRLDTLIEIVGELTDKIDSFENKVDSKLEEFTKVTRTYYVMLEYFRKALVSLNGENFEELARRNKQAFACPSFRYAGGRAECARETAEGCLFLLTGECPYGFKVTVPENAKDSEKGE